MCLLLYRGDKNHFKIQIQQRRNQGNREQRRKENNDKRAKAPLKALELRAKGGKAREVAQATGFLLPM